LSSDWVVNTQSRSIALIATKVSKSTASFNHWFGFFDFSFSGKIFILSDSVGSLLKSLLFWVPHDLKTFVKVFVIDGTIISSESTFILVDVPLVLSDFGLSSFIIGLIFFGIFR